MALVQASAMSYLGFFDLPSFGGSPPNESNSYAYGGLGLGMGPDGQSLYVGGHVNHGKIGRVTIPAIGQTASVVTDLAVVPGTYATSTEGSWLGGSLVHEGRLIVAEFGFYSEAHHVVATHASAALDFTDWTTPQLTNAVIPRAAAGYMGVIPPEWQAAFGAPCFTGSGPRSINSNGSLGPSLFAFDPSAVDGSGTVPVSTTLFYPLAHEMWKETNQLNGVAWIDDSVIFIGRGGAGNPVYQQPPNITDPCNPTNPGYKDYPYALRAWAYDANDLLAVHEGQAESWEPSPYATWNLPTFDGAPCVNINQRGGTFDPATGRFFMCTYFGGGQPRVHAYQFALENGEEPSAGGGAMVSTLYSVIL